MFSSEFPKTVAASVEDCFCAENVFADIVYLQLFIFAFDILRMRGTQNYECIESYEVACSHCIVLMRI